MKTTLFILLTALFSQISLANIADYKTDVTSNNCERTSFLLALDNDRGFSYQAVARNAEGEILSSTNIELRFSLHPNVFADIPDWQETHTTTTDEYGVFSLTIGKGIKTNSTVEKFNDLDFAAFEYWLKVEIRDSGTWEEVYFTALQSVPYAKAAGNGTMAGMIVPFAGPAENIPEGWKLCDGSQLSRTAFPALFNAIGSAWGYGDGSTTFHLPDLRGLFLRGVDGGRGKDQDRNARGVMAIGGNRGDQVGSSQVEAFKIHNHGGKTKDAGEHKHKVNRGNEQLQWGDGGGSSFNYIDAGGSRASTLRPISTGWEGNHNHRIDAEGGNETRPDNAYVNYIIKL